MNPILFAMMSRWWLAFTPAPAVPVKPPERDEPEH